MRHEFAYYGVGRVAILISGSWREYVGPAEVGRVLARDLGDRGWSLARRLNEGGQ